MKYMLMFLRKKGAWEERAPTDEMQATFAQIQEWFTSNTAAGKIVPGQQLHPASMATTVVPRSGVVTDGPFMEAKETIGGWGIVESDDLDTVIALAKTWPADNRVEIRPIVDRPDM